MRNTSGEALANQSVSFRLKLNTASKGETFYTETHTVTTTPQGIANLVVGEGTPVDGSFALVPWASEAIELQVEVDPFGGNSYVPMGVVNLKSVPYALFAPPAGAIASDPNAPDDDPIFIVRNKDGKVVFAVYQTGVRMYVEDDATKSSRGGFAIGGLADQTKESTEYFRVTPDSVRVYLREPAVKSSRGGFAIGGLADQQKTLSTDLFYIGRDSARIYIDTDVTKSSRGGFAIGGLADQQKAQGSKLMYIGQDSARIYIDTTTNAKNARGGFAIGGIGDNLKGKGKKRNLFNVSTDTTVIIDPSEARILWYPLKNAFLTGQVLIESPDSVGANSMATGFESKAIGNYTQALGYKARAFGNSSTAIGNSANAIGHSSFAFGNYAQTQGLNSFAFGDSAISNGESSYALGSHAKALGKNSFAMGSFGYDGLGLFAGPPVASGDYSYAFGMGSQASGLLSFAFGNSNIATNNYSIAMGDGNTSTAGGSIAIGRHNNATGPASTALGNYTNASGIFSTTLGNATTATGLNATAMGFETTANGDYAMAIGRKLWANEEHSIAIGSFSTADGAFSLALGNYTYASGIFSTTMGNATTASGLNATAMGFSSKASGSYSTVIGSQVKANSYASMVVGMFNDTTSISSTDWIWADPLFIIGNGLADNARSNALTVLKDGRIGIGTVSPSEKLHVAGNLKVEGNIYYPTNMIPKPDYVFSTSYTKYFEPLKVEEFIKTNGHLPWMTSANGELDGINLTRMQFETLETVENLQLQIIEMKKDYESKINKLEEKVKEFGSIKAELEAIKKMLLNK